jgi:hypothetical protein
MPTTYSFGIAETIAHTEWLIQSATETGSAQEALALDKVGEPVVAHYYQNVAELALEVIIPDGTVDVPEIGKIVKYGDKAYYVSAVTKTESNTDFRRYSITVKRFTKAGTNGLPLASDASPSI